MKTLQDKLNPQQYDAVIKTDGPLIIFAGAGTGKTRVITHRIANLISCGASPWKILAVTFTNKAAQQMRNRVDALAPGRGSSVWISTFHSFCAKFLRIEAKLIGLDPNYLIYDDSDQRSVIKTCVNELSLDDKEFKPARISEIINRAKDDMIDAGSYSIHVMASGSDFKQTVGDIYKLYDKKLKAAGALDFGDLLLITVSALRDNEVLRNKYQDRFNYIMVDEYQDTNHVQYLLVKYLAAKHKNICVVGDDDQSIYTWRGADIRNILEFERDYKSCCTVKLEENYRSTSNILESAWRVIKNNDKRVEKKLVTQKPAGEPIKLIEADNALSEAESVVMEINSIKDKSNCKYSDFAVLFREEGDRHFFEWCQTLLRLLGQQP